MSSPVPARFAEYSRRQIELYNLLATRGATLSLAEDGETRLRLLGAGTDPFEAAASARVGMVGGALELEVGPSLWQQLSTPWTAGETFESLPPGLAEAVKATALAPLLERLGELIGSELTVLDESETDLTTAAHLALNASNSGSPAALLHLSEGAVDLFVDSLEALPGGRASAEAPDLGLGFDVVLGRSRITAGELRRLEIGDVLLMAAGVGGRPGDVLLLQSGRALAEARIEGRRIIVQRLLESPMTDIDQTEFDGEGEESAEGSDSSLSLDDDGDTGSYALPDESEVDDLSDEEDGLGNEVDQLDPDELKVDLTFDLGRLSLPLGDLDQVQAGYTFELEMPARGAVRIRSASEIVGWGELVQIDDRLGVRVTKLRASSGV